MSIWEAAISFLFSFFSFVSSIAGRNQFINPIPDLKAERESFVTSTVPIQPGHILLSPLHLLLNPSSTSYLPTFPHVKSYLRCFRANVLLLLYFPIPLLTLDSSPLNSVILFLNELTLTRENVDKQPSSSDPPLLFTSHHLEFDESPLLLFYSALEPLARD